MITREISGVVVGIVRSLDDPEHEGRVQLEFPWLQKSYRSAWAPIAAALAGGGRGAFFMPEPDDEVLVAFDRGDINHPYVVGFLWNGVDRPPEKERHNRVIVTPGKHTLRFEDKEGEKKVVVRSAGGMEVVLDDVKKSVTVQTKGGQRMVLTDVPPSIELSGGQRTIKMIAGQILFQ